MKVSREQSEENHRRITEAGSKLFRIMGFDGIGLADIMKGAGLTHGGFYNHFASKDDLMAQACATALAETPDFWRSFEHETGALEKAVSLYLSPRHIVERGSGCAFAALAGEAPRQSPNVRTSFTQGLRAHVDTLGRMMGGRSRAAQRRRAMAAMATMVGGLVLARAVEDNDLANEILIAARASLGIDPPSRPTT